MASFDNRILVQNANQTELKIRHIFCGYVQTGRWKSSPPLNRLIYIFKTGRDPGLIGTPEKKCVLLPHTWLFIPAFCEVYHEENEGLKLVSVHFNAELRTGLELFSECRKIVCGSAPEYKKDFQCLAEEKSDLSGGFLLKRLLYLFLEEKILPELPSAGAFREKFRTFFPLLDAVRNDPGKILTIPEMAEIMHMGRESFIRHFQSETGSSPKLFFNRLRAAACAEALNDPSLRIRDAAFRFGFANEFYFSRFFKRHFGLSPKAYRERFCNTLKNI